MKSPRRWSIHGRLLLLCWLLVAAAIVLTNELSSLLRVSHHVIIVGLLLMTPIIIIAVNFVYQPLKRRLQALADGAASLRENDFSTSIAADMDDELGQLIRIFNDVGQVLRNERHNVFQRELLLDTVLQSAPLALVLTDPNRRIIYANPRARHLFLAGHKLEGLDFNQLLAACPQALREAVQTKREGLITIEEDGEDTIYHVASQHFVLNARDHHLYLFKPMTRELNRQEVAIWKKVIRVISHELNNSLAPIASLAHSGQSLIHQPDARRLELIFNTIAERTRHLHGFIEGYARFARLPRPSHDIVDWRSFFAGIHETIAFNLIGDLPRQPGVFDPAQMQQVLINLLKNAYEAGATAENIGIQVEESAQGWRIQVLDRGQGFAEAVLNNAVLPFYSTKKTGTGLGLALCREIIEAHEGRLSLTNRTGGGACISLWLPRGEKPNATK